LGELNCKLWCQAKPLILWHLQRSRLLHDAL
jgi:hypothetical protein